MIKPNRLLKGDTVAVVSLSRGMLGEEKYIHLLEIAKYRLEKIYGLKVKTMPNALKGVEFLYNNPKARAEDLMNAFLDKEVKAIINAIGGDDTIRLLPFIDFEIIKNNPKIFMGYSDTTINHFMMYKAGLVSYYGASLMNNWAEYVEINDYTYQAIDYAFFNPIENYVIPSAKYCSYKDKKVLFDIKNIKIKREVEIEDKGYEVLQGKGKIKGKLLGGCVETFIDLIGTSLWPSIEEWKNKILFIEVSDEDNQSELPEYYFAWIIRNLKTQGIFDVINGIIMGKPLIKEKYNTYKEVLMDIINEDKKYDFPIIYNVNFGHGYPIGIIPYGLECEIDCENKQIKILEKYTN